MWEPVHCFSLCYCSFQRINKLIFSVLPKFFFILLSCNPWLTFFIIFLAYKNLKETIQWWLLIAGNTKIWGNKAIFATSWDQSAPFMITVGHTWTDAALIVVGNILGLLLLVHIAQTSTSEILSTMDYLQRGGCRAVVSCISYWLLFSFRFCFVGGKYSSESDMLGSSLAILFLFLFLFSSLLVKFLLLWFL